MKLQNQRNLTLPVKSNFIAYMKSFELFVTCFSDGVLRATEHTLGLALRH